MYFGRRGFLKTAAFLSANFALPGSIFGMNLGEPGNSLEHVLQVDGRQFGNFNYLKNLNRLKNQALFLGTESFFEGSYSNFSFPVNAVLFTGKSYQNIDNQLNKSKSLPFINSNLELIDDSISSQVERFRIFHRNGLVIGVMGISFGQAGQSPNRIIELMNNQALRLKNDYSCDEVYCLVEDPSSYFSHFSLRDLIANSQEINYFFASSKVVKNEILKTVANFRGVPVFLNIHSMNIENKYLISMEKGQFRDFLLI